MPAQKLPPPVEYVNKLAKESANPDNTQPSQQLLSIALAFFDYLRENGLEDYIEEVDLDLAEERIDDATEILADPNQSPDNREFNAFCVADSVRDAYCIIISMAPSHAEAIDRLIFETTA